VWDLAAKPSEAGREASAQVSCRGAALKVLVGKGEQEGLPGRLPVERRREDPQVRGGARGESRTPTPFRAPDPKSGASAVPPLSRWLSADQRKGWGTGPKAGDAPDQHEVHRTKRRWSGALTQDRDGLPPGGRVMDARRAARPPLISERSSEATRRSARVSGRGAGRRAALAASAARPGPSQPPPQGPVVLSGSPPAAPPR
jgi:hypothetical protein